MEQSLLASRFENRLRNIYQDIDFPNIARDILAIIENNRKEITERREKWNERDAILITYGGSIQATGESPLRTLKNFLDTRLNHIISCTHILPFFPFSSDDGFSVIDYTAVDPDLGNWEDVNALREHFDLMFDLVINHISQKSTWFHNYLNDISPGKDYFIEANPNQDLSNVVRPRSLPLLTPFETKKGEKHLWTTFSDDQIDLNFGNPEVLLKMLEILAMYIRNGSRIIRLDAIAFLWKIPGTSCLHLKETHQVVKLIREVAEAIDPGCIILTETNVPNKENLSYFGDGDEAHMVYQFSLPPLLLHALNTGNGNYLTKWADSLPEIQANQTFFNFTASHDGIGVRPLEGLIPAEELSQLLTCMQSFGAKVSTKTNSDGSESPYEINITYFDALKGTSGGKDDLQVSRFLCSQTLMMSLKGIPAFYIHSLTATQNYYAGVEQTGRARTINRRVWNRDELESLLNTETHTSAVFNDLTRRIALRGKQPAFNPSADQKVLNILPAVFAIRRQTVNQEIVILANLLNQNQSILRAAFSDKFTEYYDILTDTPVLTGEKHLILKPYQVVWLVNLEK